MLKKLTLRKLTVTSLALLLVLLIYLFPSNTVKTTKDINYIEEDKLLSVFLIDQNNYVSEVNVYINEDSLEDIIKSKVESLIISSSKIPKSFRGIIPINTKINKVSIEKDTAYIDFSKEILNVSASDEGKMIEAIVYTVTSSEEVSKVVILVDGKKLDRLPFSNKILPNVLDRSYGINKDYDINSIYNLTKTTIYYTSKVDDISYYIPVTKVSNESEDKVYIIVSELKSSPLYQSNLYSYLNNKASLKKYEIEKDVINLTFNDKIFDSIYNQNILEEVVYTLGKSMIDTFNIKEVNFYVNDKKITSYK